jgi:hypothetical protein
MRTFDTPQMMAITFLMPATLLCGYLVARLLLEGEFVLADDADGKSAVKQ